MRARAASCREAEREKREKQKNVREEREEIDDDDGGETGVGDVADEVDEEVEREQHHRGGNDRVHGRLRADVVDQRRPTQRAGGRIRGEEAAEQRAAPQRDELLVLVDLVAFLRSQPRRSAYLAREGLAHRDGDHERDGPDQNALRNHAREMMPVRNRQRREAGVQLVFAHVVQTPPVVQVEEPHQQHVHDDEKQLEKRNGETENLHRERDARKHAGVELFEGVEEKHGANAHQKRVPIVRGDRFGVEDVEEDSEKGVFVG